ncbi:hypothetical protein CEUSTIGMA_g6759.t1 [Chlamydomonas eustigma]|uniref:Uncharacterized protein n=1 Tax=Chlamydomonas eustigma TaxID=1157962 RepID=A0A250X8B4_9CHLO|nr:hypothetical protein CEUSTIGMA_g6759.t1 [Chlamydomonas eustigma]|eukprot:GAX79318.1 hypothetical protein CEUSTIGMA_g6759.t1 [Chlamydomonas eustigma]
MCQTKAEEQLAQIMLGTAEALSKTPSYSVLVTMLEQNANPSPNQHAFPPPAAMLQQPSTAAAFPAIPPCCHAATAIRYCCLSYPSPTSYHAATAIRYLPSPHFLPCCNSHQVLLPFLPSPHFLPCCNSHQVLLPFLPSFSGNNIRTSAEG